jgi:hypothetical protein
VYTWFAKMKMVAFYNERADLIVDGERQRRPKTKFS